MKIIYTTIAVLTMTTALSARADMDDTSYSATGLFLEPGITYQMTDSNIDYPAPFTNSSASTRGFGVMARGGAHVFDRFFVAADARYAMLNYNDNANNISVGATSWDIAPVVGLQMKDSGMRIFAGYVLGGNLDPHSANSFDYRFKDANGWRIGAGLKYKMVSVNLEWQRLHYATTELQSAGNITTNASSTGSHYNGEGIVASVTFPIEFH